jgi:hypothetical protein
MPRRLAELWAAAPARSSPTMRPDLVAGAAQDSPGDALPPARSLAGKQRSTVETNELTNGRGGMARCASV